MDMRKSKKKWKGISILMAAALSVGTLFGSLTAFGAQAEAHPDLTQKGSVSVTMVDKSTGKAVGGGEMILYQVAKVERQDWNDSFAYTETFAECTLPLENLESGELAGGLAAFVKGKGINGEKKAIGSDGVVKYTELEVGLYLLVQSGAASGYEAVTPFLAAVPMMINGELHYDVDATPKTSGVTAVPVKPTRPSGSGDNDDSDYDPGSSGGTKKPPVTVITTTDTITDETKAQEPETTGPTDIITLPEKTKPDFSIPTDILPKTGQLWWPVPVLAAAGVLFFLFGWADRRRKG